MVMISEASSIGRLSGGDELPCGAGWLTRSGGGAGPSQQCPQGHSGQPLTRHTRSPYPDTTASRAWSEVLSLSRDRGARLSP
jgi:hypothetical protein